MKMRIAKLTKQNAKKKKKDAKSKHFHFDMDNQLSSKRTNKLREALEIEARNTFRRMALALRQQYNRRYEAVIGRIRAKVRVKARRSSLRAETVPVDLKTTPIQGTGVKFLLAKTFG
jgi:hypothetical protein